MRESANLCENRLLSYRGTDNAALGTSVSFLPISRSVLVKTEATVAKATQAEVKTEKRPFVVNIRWGHLDRMPKCQHGRVICSECGL